MSTATALPLNFNARKGFGLLEVILVFAIVIGAAAVVFSVFQSAKPSADAANEAQLTSTIAANLRSTFGINHDYTGLTTTTAIDAKVIPASMVQPDGTLRNEWGQVQLAAWYANPRQFDINMNYIPLSACAKFIAGLAPSFDDVLVAGSGPSDTGGSVFTNGKLDMAKLNTWCSGSGSSDGATVGADFIGH